MRILCLPCSFLTVILAWQTANAAAPTPATLSHLIPAELHAGDEFQLLFVTRDRRDAYSDDILEYNAFVASAADAAGIGPLTSGLEWFAMASTQAIDARDNAVVLAPVYNMQGDLLANGVADMWDGALINHIEYDEQGISVISYPHVWTGSKPDGTKDPRFALGTGATEMGYPRTSNSLWIAGTRGYAGLAFRMYALSEPLLVTRVPEPWSVALTAVASLGMLQSRRRIASDDSP